MSTGNGITHCENLPAQEKECQSPDRASGQISTPFGASVGEASSGSEQRLRRKLTLGLLSAQP